MCVCRIMRWRNSTIHQAAGGRPKSSDQRPETKAKHRICVHCKCGSFSVGQTRRTTIVHAFLRHRTFCHLHFTLLDLLSSLSLSLSSHPLFLNKGTNHTPSHSLRPHLILLRTSQQHRLVLRCPVGRRVALLRASLALAIRLLALSAAAARILQETKAKRLLPVSMLLLPHPGTTLKSRYNVHSQSGLLFFVATAISDANNQTIAKVNVVAHYIQIT